VFKDWVFEREQHGFKRCVVPTACVSLRNLVEADAIFAPVVFQLGVDGCGVHAFAFLQDIQFPPRRDLPGVIEHVARLQVFEEVIDSEWEVFLPQCIRKPGEALSEIFAGGREVSLSVGNIDDPEPSERAEESLMLQDKAFELPQREQPLINESEADRRVLVFSVRQRRNRKVVREIPLLGTTYR
jgi:hypothetical protein